DLLQVGRHPLEVVVADDALDLAEAGDAGDDVGLEVDPVDAGDDGLAQEHAAGVLGVGQRPPSAGRRTGATTGHGLSMRSRLKSGGLARKSRRSSMNLAPCLTASCTSAWTILCRVRPTTTQIGSTFNSSTTNTPAPGDG